MIIAPDSSVGELRGYRFIWIQPCRTQCDCMIEPWQSPGPSCAPTSYPHLRITTESPPPPPLHLSTVQSLYSLQHPSLKCGRSHQGLALNYGSLVRGGICQGQSACLFVFHHITFGYKNCADLGHFYFSP